MSTRVSLKGPTQEDISMSISHHHFRKHVALPMPRCAYTTDRHSCTKSAQTLRFDEASESPAEASADVRKRKKLVVDLRCFGSRSQAQTGGK
jgi:hypothetical protein